MNREYGHTRIEHVVGRNPVVFASKNGDHPMELADIMVLGKELSLTIIMGYEELRALVESAKLVLAEHDSDVIKGTVSNTMNHHLTEGTGD